MTFSILGLSKKRLFGVVERIKYIQSRTKYKTIAHSLETYHIKYYADEWKSDKCAYYKHKIRASTKRKRGFKFGGGGIPPLHGGEPYLPDPSIIPLHEIAVIARNVAIQNIKNPEFWKQFCEVVRSVRDMLDIKDVVLYLDCLVAVNYRHTDLLKLLGREIIEDIFKLNPEELSVMLNCYSHFNCQHNKLMYTCNEYIIACMSLEENTHAYFLENSKTHEDRNLKLLNEGENEESSGIAGDENSEEPKKLLFLEVETRDAIQAEEKKSVATAPKKPFLLEENKNMDETVMLNSCMSLNKLQIAMSRLTKEIKKNKVELSSSHANNSFCLSIASLGLILKSYAALKVFNQQLFVCSAVYMTSFLKQNERFTLESTSTCVCSFAKFLTFMSNSNRGDKSFNRSVLKHRNVFSELVEVVQNKVLEDQEEIKNFSSTFYKNNLNLHTISETFFLSLSNCLYSLFSICLIFRFSVRHTLYENIIAIILHSLQNKWNSTKSKFINSTHPSSNKLFPFRLLHTTNPLLSIQNSKQSQTIQNHNNLELCNLNSFEEEELDNTEVKDEKTKKVKNSSFFRNMYKDIKSENSFRDKFYSYDFHLTYETIKFVESIITLLKIIHLKWKNDVRKLQKIKIENLRENRDKSNFCLESSNSKKNKTSYVMCDLTDRNIYAFLYCNIRTLNISDNEKNCLDIVGKIFNEVGVDRLSTESLSSLFEIFALYSIYKSEKTDSISFPQNKRKKIEKQNHLEKEENKNKNSLLSENATLEENTKCSQSKRNKKAAYTPYLFRGKIILDKTIEELLDKTAKAIIKKFVNFEAEDIYRIKLAARNAHIKNPYLNFYFKNYSSHLKFSKLRNQLNLNDLSNF